MELSEPSISRPNEAISRAWSKLTGDEGGPAVRRHRTAAIRTAGLLLILIAALAAPAAADEAATQAARTAIRTKVPSVKRLFVNCPAENTFTASDGSSGI